MKTNLAKKGAQRKQILKFMQNTAKHNFTPSIKSLILHIHTYSPYSIDGVILKYYHENHLSKNTCLTLTKYLKFYLLFLFFPLKARIFLKFFSAIIKLDLP